MRRFDDVLGGVGWFWRFYRIFGEFGLEHRERLWAVGLPDSVAAGTPKREIGQDVFRESCERVLPGGVGRECPGPCSFKWRQRLEGAVRIHAQVSDGWTDDFDAGGGWLFNRFSGQQA